MANWSEVNVEKENHVDTESVRIVSHKQIEETNPRVYIERGVMFSQAGKYKECEAELQKACSLAESTEEKKLTEEYMGYYKWLFETKQTSKHYIYAPFISGIWLLIHGLWIIIALCVWSEISRKETIFDIPWISALTIMIVNDFWMFLQILDAVNKLKTPKGKIFTNAFFKNKIENLKSGGVIFSILLLLSLGLKYLGNLDEFEIFSILLIFSVLIGIIQVIYFLLMRALEMDDKIEDVSIEQTLDTKPKLYAERGKAFAMKNQIREAEQEYQKAYVYSGKSKEYNALLKDFYMAFMFRKGLTKFNQDLKSGFLFKIVLYGFIGWLFFLSIEDDFMNDIAEYLSMSIFGIFSLYFEILILFRINSLKAYNKISKTIANRITIFSGLLCIILCSVLAMIFSILFENLFSIISFEIISIILKLPAIIVVGKFLIKFLRKRASKK